MTNRRLKQGGRINRKKPINFTFNGKPLSGYAGDTLASALMANNIDIMGRSFKYHRPRGIIGSWAEEPNAIVQIGTGAKTIPNQRATQVELYDRLCARVINAWPNLDNDVGSVNNLFSRLLPAGFYYKTFMWPTNLWEKYEQVIRKSAGLGKSPTLPDADRYEKFNHHCDVFVVGGGIAGLSAAVVAAKSGARVTLVDDQKRFGGQLLNDQYLINDKPAMDYASDLIEQLKQFDNVKLLKRTTAYGYFDHNFLAAVQRISDHKPHSNKKNLPRERMWRIRAKQVVLATGAFERPLVFHNNDIPGVMLASAISTYLNRYAVKAGKQVIFFTNNDHAYQNVIDCIENGFEVVAVVDCRRNSHGSLVAKARELGVRVFNQHVVTNVSGSKRVKSVSISAINAQNKVIKGTTKQIACDTLAMSGGYSPAIHLHAQSGGKPKWNNELACFIPGKSVQAEQSCGAAAGRFSLKEALLDGIEAGYQAVSKCDFKAAHPNLPDLEEQTITPLQHMWLVPSNHANRKGPKQFVDYQNDTSASDIMLAVQEGFKSIEHIKRYTALGFGTDQGKLGNINGMGIAAQVMNKTIPETGTTTFRPAYTPVTFATVAGRELGDLFDPVRKTAIHPWHVEHNAEFENVGQWKRPWYYPKAGEDMDSAVNRECLAARNSVGIMDASTLGKIDIKGPDVAEFLNRMYTNAWKKLAIGRCRYGLMLGEDGMVMDDGVTTRIGEDHYYMTTTTGGAANVLAWLERWLQTEWPELKVLLTSVTDQWATISLAGPDSIKVISKICDDVDFDSDSFEFMSMQQATIAGVPGRIFRISFSGELSYEINVPSNYGLHVWRACMTAGEEYSITPYGTEAMHVLRAEKGFIIVGQDTDGSVTPHDLGMSWIVSKNKDFIGKRSLSRSDCLREDRKQLVGIKSEIPHQVIPEGAQLIEDANLTEKPVPMIGHVSSSYYSGTLQTGIALALVKNGRKRMGEKVYAPLADGRTLVGEICNSVFYDEKGERQHV